MNTDKIKSEDQEQIGDQGSSLVFYLLICVRLCVSVADRSLRFNSVDLRPIRIFGFLSTCIGSYRLLWGLEF